MAKSAGIVYRYRDSRLEIFSSIRVVRFGRTRIRAWSIPKGEFEPGEDPLKAARRGEFHEETGFAVDGSFVLLTPVRQAGGKVVHAWAVEGDCEAESIKSNSFILEWPPRSGQRKTFSEVDRAEWFSLELARDKILKGQLKLLDELQRILKTLSRR